MEIRLANSHSVNITDHALLSSTLVGLAYVGIGRRPGNTRPCCRSTSNCRRRGLIRRPPNVSFADTCCRREPQTENKINRNIRSVLGQPSLLRNLSKV